MHVNPINVHSIDNMSIQIKPIQPQMAPPPRIMYQVNFQQTTGRILRVAEIKVRTIRVCPPDRVAEIEAQIIENLSNQML